MFAALSHYEQRFQTLERVLTQSALTLERLNRSVEEIKTQIRDISEILELLETRLKLDYSDEEKVCV